MNASFRTALTAFLLFVIAIDLSAQNTKKMTSPADAVFYLSKHYPDAGVPWEITPDKAGLNGEALSAGNALSGDWPKAVVPGTVLTSYVQDGLEPDPDIADNIYKIDTAKYNRPFWYRTSFRIPASFTGREIWLNFDGINKYGVVYLNGHPVKGGQLTGMMERGHFNITSLLRKDAKNTLAVRVAPPVYYPHHELANYSSPTYICSQGWDWMPLVPGFNSGITDQVYLSCSGPVNISDLWVRTALPDSSHSRADLAVSLTLKKSRGTPVKGKVKLLIQPGNIELSSREILLSDTLNHELTFTKETFPQLTVLHPHLWWPNGYGGKKDGTQYLYQCKACFVTDKGSSDEDSARFGIRVFSYDTIGGPLHIYVNHVPVYIKGGNWGMSQYMLRVHDTAYDTRVRFHKEMNFNMIRNWTGEVTDEAFYDACDKYGILVWDDFWLNGPGPIDDQDSAIFKTNVVEKIRRLRNHASIAVWCGANEGVPGFGAGSVPGRIIANAIRTYDKNAYNDQMQRLYAPRSNGGASNDYVTGNSHNLSGSGLWDNKAPAVYFSHPDNGYPWSKGSWGFRTELGTATFPNIESFKRFMPADSLWPKNSLWDKHFFDNLNGSKPLQYMQDISSEYGQPDGVEDFCRKAQLINLATTKAMFEGWQEHMWHDASGLLMWMSQSAYPSMVWQTYDYYYDLTGAYFGAMQACEPVHIQWNSANDSITVINNRPYALDDLTATVSVYDLSGNEYTGLRGQTSLSVGPTRALSVLKLNTLTSRRKLSPVYFLQLALKDKKGKVLSHNFYWCGNHALDYRALNTLPPLKPGSLRVSGRQEQKLDNGHVLLTYTLTNPKSSPGIAFGVRVKMLKADGELLLPVILNDNYFTLMRGASKQIRIEYDPALLDGKKYSLVAEPYNQHNH